jgi:hypothetical protein
VGYVEQGRSALSRYRLQEGQHPVPVRLVQAVAGLVQDQQLGHLDRRPGDQEGPLLAEGKASESLRRPAGEARQLQPAAGEQALAVSHRLVKADGVVEARH